MKILKSLILLTLCAQFNLQAQYSKVVSLAPSITKSIYFLGAQEKLVGCTNYCTTQPGDNVQVVSSPMNVNVEKVVSLKPDLVLATSITSLEYIEMLRKFNIKVEVFPTPKSYGEIGEQFIKIGTLLGKTDMATHLTDSIDQEVNRLKTLHPTSKNENIFIQIGSHPIYTVIPNTFMDDYISFLNGTNIAADLTKGSISRESVIHRKPDYIFIVTMGIVGKNEMETWKTFTNIPAIKNKHIYIIDSDLACTPTPQTFLQTLKLMDKLINN